MEHYYIQKPQCTYKEYTIRDNVRGYPLLLKSASGVFAATKIDKGSRILAEYFKASNSKTILDLGCGYGLIGIVAAKTFPKAKVTMVDINERAVMLAQFNTKANAVDAEVFQSDGYSAVEGRKFDVILLNPPQCAGKELCFDLIRKAQKYLKTGGSLQIVARRNKGGASLFSLMDEVFPKTEVIAKKGGYWVYLGKISEKAF